LKKSSASRFFELSAEKSSNKKIKNMALCYYALCKLENELKEEYIDILNTTLKSGELDKVLYKVALEKFKLSKPVKYNFYCRAYIKNWFGYPMTDVKVELTVPFTIQNRQDVKILNEFSNLQYLKFIKNDKYNNQIYVYNFKKIDSFKICRIDLEFEVVVKPFSLDNEFFKRTSSYKIIKKNYDFTLKNIEYDVNAPDYSFNEILFIKKGKCTEYTRVFNTLLKKNNFRVLDVSGRTFSFENQIGNLNFLGHSWTEVFIPELKQWVPFDPTFQDTSGNNFFGRLNSDRVIIAFNKKQNINIKYSVLGNNKTNPEINVEYELEPAFIKN
jgi:hypothetical protein